MNALQGMDMNQFIIIAPTMLIAMYLIITLQKKLSNGKNPKYGLILPVICFVVATVLAFKPLFTVGASADGMVGAALVVWMTFNIPTLALLFPYLIALKNRKEAAMLAEAMAAAAEKEKAESKSSEVVDAEIESVACEENA